MKIFILLAVCLSPLVSSAFILIDPDYHLANPKDTVVNIANQTCPNVGVSNETLQAAIEISINEFWNTVAESNLRFKMGGVVSKTTLAEVSPGEILVGCSNTAGTGGVTNPNVTDGTAFVELNADVEQAGFDNIVRVVVHEMGHAVGLNHSADPASVMTYESHAWGPRPDSLSQDDKNGVVYLYPNEGQAGGLVPGCSVNAQGRDRKPSDIFQAVLQEIFGLLTVFFLARILVRSF